MKSTNVEDRAVNTKYIRWAIKPAITNENLRKAKMMDKFEDSIVN